MESAESISEPEESVIYTGRACSYVSQTGVSLHFPAAKCPKPVKVSVKVVSGDYTLPPEYEGMPLVSSMFKITASGTLPAPISVRLEHCAVVDREDCLVHMVAEDTHPYYFKQLPGGKFPIGGSYGEIKLEKFSTFTTICRIFGLYINLSVFLFYHKDSTATFVATKNLRELNEAVTEKFYDAVEKLELSMMCYCYTTREITLTIPPAKDGGWSIEPKSMPPKIETECIRNYERGMIPPSIQLKMKWTGRGPPKDEDIEIKLGGCSKESFTLSCMSPHKRQSQSLTQQSPANSEAENSTEWINPCAGFALRRSNEIFVGAVDPENIVPVLYSNGLLTKEEKQKATQQSSTACQRLEEIFKAMERRVHVDPQCFHTLLQALSKESATKGVAKKMKGKPTSFSIMVQHFTCTFTA